MKTLFLAAFVALTLAACASNPPGAEPNHWIHQLGLEGGGG